MAATTAIGQQGRVPHAACAEKFMDIAKARVELGKVQATGRALARVLERRQADVRPSWSGVERSPEEGGTARSVATSPRRR